MGSLRPATGGGSPETAQISEQQATRRGVSTALRAAGPPLRADGPPFRTALRGPPDPRPFDNTTLYTGVLP